VTDDRGRALERAWRAGDPQAGAALAQHLVRTGGLTLEWIATLGPLAHAAIASLPDQLLEAASYALARTPGGAAGALARSLCERDEDWYPDHRRADVCPRGHVFAVHPRRHSHSNFALEGSSLEFRSVTGVRPDLGPGGGMILADGSYWERHGREAAPNWAFLRCEQRLPKQGHVICSASWHVPSDQVEYE